MKFAQQVANNRPLLISGDFNAEPNEPVYSTVLGCDALSLSSAYADMLATLEKESTKQLAEFEEVSNDLLDSKVEVIEEQSRIDYLMSKEPPFTTWKIREDGEVCHTIDYIFYSHDKFKVIYIIFELSKYRHLLCMLSVFIDQ